MMGTSGQFVALHGVPVPERVDPPVRASHLPVSSLRLRRDRHDRLQARPTPPDDHRGRRYRRHRSGAPARPGRLHDESDPDPEGGRDAGLCRSGRRGDRLGQQGRPGRRHGPCRLRPSRRHLRGRTDQDRARPGLDRGRCRPVLRHQGHDRQGARAHRRLSGARDREGSHPRQDRLDLGGHPGGQGAACFPCRRRWPARMPAPS